MSSASLKYTRIAIGFIIAVGLVFLPFLSNGVFFSHGQFVLDAILLGTMVIAVVILCARRTVREALLVGDGIRYGDIAVLLFTLLYIIALFYAANMDLAVEGALNALALLIPYIAFRFISVRRSIGYWVGIGFALSSVVIGVLGLANGWGQLKYPSAVEVTPQHQVEIASVFQYHNAFAVFAASVATGLFVWSALSSTRWLWRMLAIGVASLNVLSLLASGSRGALAIWAVVMILAVIGLRNRNRDNPLELRNRLLGDVYIGLIGGFAGYVLAHHAITTSKAAMGWLGIIVAIVLPMLLVALRSILWTPRNPLPGKRGLWSLIGVGVVLGILGAAFKWHSVIAKLHSYHANQLSVSQRFIFWGDGFKIFARNPVSGWGYGAWQAMYQRVQSYPYISSRVHSYGMDILMETGILGFVCLIALGWPLLRQVVWPKLTQLTDTCSSDDHGDVSQTSAVGSAFIAGGLMLLAHSVMDWDMSFEYLLLIFYCAAGVAASRTAPLKKVPGLAHLGYTIPIGIVSLGALVMSLTGLRAEALASNASGEPASVAGQSYQAAFRWAPYNDGYLTDRVGTLLKGKPDRQQEEEAQQLVRQAERLNPYSYHIAENYAELAYNLGNVNVAFQQAMLAAKNAPFWPSPISLAIRAGTVDAMKQASSNPTQAKATFEQVRSLYAEYVKRKAIIKGLPSYLPPATKYTLDDFSVVSVAASDLVLHHPQQAVSLAKSKLHSKDSHSQLLANLVVLMVQKPQQVSGYVAKNKSIASSYALLENAVKKVH